MRILVLGSDGYIGYPLTIHLLKLGHSVMGVDDYSRRRRVNELGGASLTPIEPAIMRKAHMSREYDRYFSEVGCSLGNDSSGFIKSILASFMPDTIVHLAEQPSAPWSMYSVENCKQTQLSNVLGTLDLLWAMKEECPAAHLVKLGTMGEYGTPNCDIPEGMIPERCLDPDYSHGPQGHSCPMRGLPFPRSPNSFYHLSKVHDTHNIIFASNTWGLACTDIMQGIVFGVRVGKEKGIELTRFDYDECFGTVINRFCVQAVAGIPLTIYGGGGQTRGFLPLKDSINCIALIINNPPDRFTYRTFNQFGTTRTIYDLANIVIREASHYGINPIVRHLSNPRTEQENHHFEPDNSSLIKLGYTPSMTEEQIGILIGDVLKHKDDINTGVIEPSITWT